jgi:hypothetical protein
MGHPQQLTLKRFNMRFNAFCQELNKAKVLLGKLNWFKAGSSPLAFQPDPRAVTLQRTLTFGG